MSGPGARDAILGSIRRSLGRGPLDEAARAALDEKLASPAPNIVPARSDISQDERIALFTSMAEAVFATVERVSGADAVPGAVADYLAGQNLPPALVMAPDPALDDYPWADRPMLDIRRGVAEEADRVAVTSALMGFAETGTLMMASGPDHPSTLNFLPETHVVVLPAERIGGAYEEGWAKLRAESAPEEGGGFMPRTVNLVTGPSRTADIEQTITLGAHGPRRLHIVIVEGGAP
ncbi:MAG: lactate utilization protein [Rhodospirillales bacterium]|nr:lactate utilization protein [Rhodospirillales bacterium]MDE0379719.1 lactate utilization protein [Rhodospirillales bacterium]